MWKCRTCGWLHVAQHSSCHWCASDTSRGTGGSRARWGRRQAARDKDEDKSSPHSGDIAEGRQALLDIAARKSKEQEGAAPANKDGAAGNDSVGVAGSVAPAPVTVDKPDAIAGTGTEAEAQYLAAKKNFEAAKDSLGAEHDVTKQMQERMAQTHALLQQKRGSSQRDIQNTSRKVAKLRARVRRSEEALAKAQSAASVALARVNQAEDDLVEARGQLENMEKLQKVHATRLLNPASTMALEIDDSGIEIFAELQQTMQRLQHKLQDRPDLQSQIPTIVKGALKNGLGFDDDDEEDEDDEDDGSSSDAAMSTGRQSGAKQGRTLPEVGLPIGGGQSQVPQPPPPPRGHTPRVVPPPGGDASGSTRGREPTRKRSSTRSRERKQRG